jgi:hypothetical protein
VRKETVPSFTHTHTHTHTHTFTCLLTNRYSTLIPFRFPSATFVRETEPNFDPEMVQGLPRDNGVFYSIGFALIGEGVFSAVSIQKDQKDKKHSRSDSMLGRADL